MFEDESNQPERSDGLSEEGAKEKDQNKNPRLPAQSHTLHPDHDKRRLVSYLYIIMVTSIHASPTSILEN